MNIQNPKISVLMPVYNGEKYLNQAIESILNQTFTNFEFLIINDGSPDKSDKVIQSYNDNRIRFINNRENKGLIATLNEGLEMAKGEYIARMDQDDISSPDRLEEQYNFLKKNSDITLVGGWAEVINNQGEIIGKKILLTDYYSIKFNLLLRNPFIHSTIFFRKNVVEELGGYSEKHEHAEDYELYSRMAKKHIIANIPKVLLKFRIHNQSIGQISETKKIQEKTRKKIISDNINRYCELRPEDLEIIDNAREISSLKNLIKMLLTSRRIFKAYIKKEKPDKKQSKKLHSIYRQKNRRIIRKCIINILKKYSILYRLAKTIFRYSKRLALIVRLTPKITSNYLFLRYKKDIKLHLGSGNVKISGYTNVDSLLLPNVDIVSNIENLKYFIGKNSVSRIYTSHLLEHFSHKKIKKILKLCYNLLRKDGELRISVPDMDKIVKIYYKNWEHFQTPGNSPWIGLMWGGQSTKYDYHKTGFNFCWMKHLLEEESFTDIKEYDAKKFLGKYDIKDGSLADGTFGEPISLNVIAKK